MFQFQLFDAAPLQIRKRKYTHRAKQLEAVFISLGGGVQSSTIVEMYVEGDLHLPRLDGVLFADTGDEPDWVYQQVAYLREQLKTVGVPLLTVAKGSLVADIQAEFGRFITMPLWVRGEHGKPSMIRRQCTREYKLEPMRDAVLDILIERNLAKQIQRKDGSTIRRVNPGVLVKQVVGISLDEFQRACEAYKFNPAWLQTDYPLLAPYRMRRSDCVKYLQSRQLPIPKKSSCKVCPYHDDYFWLDAYEHYRAAVFEPACAFDEWLRTPAGRQRVKLNAEAFLHRSLLPLRSLPFMAAAGAPESATLTEYAPCDHCMM